MLMKLMPGYNRLPRFVQFLIEPIEGGTENGKQNKILKKKYIEGNSKGVKLF
jgi:hypothetical protein